MQSHRQFYRITIYIQNTKDAPKCINYAIFYGGKNLLIVFHKLIKTEKNSKPTSTVVRLKIESNFLHNCSPATRVIMLDNMMNASSKLYSRNQMHND